jgi:hypothetical protein
MSRTWRLKKFGKVFSRRRKKRRMNKQKVDESCIESILGV